MLQALVKFSLKFRSIVVALACVLLAYGFYVAKNAKLVWIAPPEDDPGISYVAVVVQGGKPAAAAYVEWLRSEAFLARAEALGFLRPVH